MSEINFDSILPMETPVTLAGRKYRLVEPKSEATKRFRQLMGESMKVLPDGGQVLSNPSKALDAHVWLISQCLYDDSGKLVEESFIRELPNRIVEALMKGVTDLCGFDVAKADKEELKNS